MNTPPSLASHSPLVLLFFCFNETMVAQHFKITGAGLSIIITIILSYNCFLLAVLLVGHFYCKTTSSVKLMKSKCRVRPNAFL